MTKSNKRINGFVSKSTLSLPELGSHLFAFMENQFIDNYKFNLPKHNW